MSKQQAATVSSTPVTALVVPAASTTTPSAPAKEVTATLPAAPPAAEPAAVERSADEEQPEKPVQANRSRCFSCNKKVGLLGFECR